MWCHPGQQNEGYSNQTVFTLNTVHFSHMVIQLQFQVLGKTCYHLFATLESYCHLPFTHVCETFFFFFFLILLISM